MGYLFSDKYENSIVTCVNNITFSSLISSKQHLVAELHITLLRPEAPGQIITQSGDIDNRLKTLLDALRIPKNTQEIPKGYRPQSNEIPVFHCLLEDDNLITKISVETDRLLENPKDSSFVKLFLHVRSKAIVRTNENIGFT